MKLSEKQVHAAFMLNCGYQTKEIAEKLEVTSATVCNWKNKTDFIVLRNKLLKEDLEEASRQLTGLVSEAVETLGCLLRAEDARIVLKTCELILSSNGLIGDNDRSFMRYGLHIGPTTPTEYEGEQQNERLAQLMSGF